MSDYRRLISYIYAYEGGVKGRNIGFAKIETRGGQCKIQVSVRRIYVGGQDVGVYLLAADREIMLGKIFLRGGSGEFRAVVPFDNVNGTGRGMDQCYGLTIHSVDDAWRCYTTIWEDAVAHAAAVELEEATSANAEAKAMEKVPAAEITEKNLAELDGAPRESVTASIEREITETPPSPPQPEIPLVPRPDVRPETRPDMQPTEPQPIEIPALPRPDAIPETPSQSEMSQVLSQTPSETAFQQPDAAPRLANDAASPSPAAETPPQPASVAETPPQPAPVAETSPQSAPAAETPPQPEGQSAAQIHLPDPEDQPERDDAGRLWSHFKRHYPKIQAFDYHGGCEILLIKPQDIGLLPRETWSYGNNSFLLHGYYNHRYLILARLSSPDGAVRFLLGVPGHYYSNEKYMASMFGFPNFVLSKMQPAGDGRFGYWYTDIRLTEENTK